jgi:hypothetical protein
MPLTTSPNGRPWMTARREIAAPEARERTAHFVEAIFQEASNR